MPENTNQLRRDCPRPDCAALSDGGPPEEARIRDITSLTGFQRDVLLVVADLSGTEPSGSDIEARLREHHFEDVSHGSLYRNLRELHDDGYIAKSPVDGRTYSHHLTDRARECLAAYLQWATACLHGEGDVDGTGDSGFGDRRPPGERDGESDR